MCPRSVHACSIIIAINKLYDITVMTIEYHFNQSRLTSRIISIINSAFITPLSRWRWNWNRYLRTSTCKSNTGNNIRSITKLPINSCVERTEVKNQLQFYSRPRLTTSSMLLHQMVRVSQNYTVKQSK